MQRRYSVRASRIQASKSFSKRRSLSDSKMGLAMGLSPEWFDLINVQVPEDVRRKKPQEVIDVVIFYNAEIKRKANKEQSFELDCSGQTQNQKWLHTVLREQIQSITTDDEINAELDKFRQKSEMSDNYEEFKLIHQGISSAFHHQSKTPVTIHKIDMTQQLCKKSVLHDFFILRSLKHKNLVNFIESYMQNDMLWIVMELPQGLRLSELIALKELKECEILALSYELLTALSYLHGNGIIHRNFMSGNVVLGSEGTVKLTSYGFCTNHQTIGNVEKNYIPYWLPPEAIKGKLSSKIDIWSLGILVVEMLERVKPYTEVLPIYGLYLISTGEIPTLTKRKTYSQNMRNFLEQTLQVDDLKRVTAEELINNMDIFQDKSDLGFFDKILKSRN